MSMDIYTKPGALVRFAYPDNGYKHDKETAAKHLVFDTNYTVHDTVVHGWNTDVYLEGFPNIRFNSVMFEDVE